MGDTFWNVTACKIIGLYLYFLSQGNLFPENIYILGRRKPQIQ